jgi:hypothetical protein
MVRTPRVSAVGSAPAPTLCAKIAGFTTFFEISHALQQGLGFLMSFEYNVRC